MQLLRTLFSKESEVLGEFAKLQKATIGFVKYVCPSVRME